MVWSLLQYQTPLWIMWRFRPFLAIAFYAPKMLDVGFSDVIMLLACNLSVIEAPLNTRSSRIVWHFFVDVEIKLLLQSHLWHRLVFAILVFLHAIHQWRNKWSAYEYIIATFATKCVYWPILQCYYIRFVCVGYRWRRRTVAGLSSARSSVFVS